VRWLQARAAGGDAWRIGRIHGLLRRHQQHAPQRPPPMATLCPRLLRRTQRAAAASPARRGARRHTALQAPWGFGGCCTCASAWGRVAPQGSTGTTTPGRDLGKAKGAHAPYIGDGSLVLRKPKILRGKARASQGPGQSPTQARALVRHKAGKAVECGLPSLLRRLDGG
jgi:hypothetical protein